MRAPEAVTARRSSVLFLTPREASGGADSSSTVAHPMESEGDSVQPKRPRLDEEHAHTRLSTPLKLQPDVEKFLSKWWSTENLERICSALSNLPAATLRVNTLKCTAEDLIEKVKAHFRTLENPQALDVAASIARHPLLEDILVMRRCQSSEVVKPLPLGGSAKGSAGAVWVDRFCGEAVLKGAEVYAPGILAMTDNCQVGDHVSVFADIDGIISKGATCAPEAGDMFFLGNGITVLGRAELFPTGGGRATNRGLAISMTETQFYSPSMNGVLSGLLYAQSLPSAVVGHVLGAQPGEQVLDMCAAPGGKTTHIATLMKNEGRVVAFDRGKAKVEKIKNTAAEMGITIIEAYANDALKYHRYIVGCLRKDGKPAENLKLALEKQSFDRILLDPPCSALGVRPRLKQEASMDELKTHAAHQRNFLRAAVMLLKVGGILVYSTCTLNPLENEGNVRWALDNFPLELIAHEPRIGDQGLPDADLSLEEAKHVQRFTPGFSEFAGFFISKFRKTGPFV